MATKPPINDVKTLVRASHTIYGIMTIVGLLVLHFGHGNLTTVFAPRTEHMSSAKLVLSIFLATGFLLILSYAFEDFFPGYKGLKNEITELLGSISFPTAIYLALISAVGEELLFRGALQPYFGLVLTSIIFGLLHVGPTSGISMWSIWAFVAGLLLGWMFEESQLLWPSIATHFLVNGVSLNLIRHSYKESHKHNITPPAKQTEKNGQEL